MASVIGCVQANSLCWCFCPLQLPRQMCVSQTSAPLKNTERTLQRRWKDRETRDFTHTSTHALGVTHFASGFFFFFFSCCHRWSDGLLVFAQLWPTSGPGARVLKGIKSAQRCCPVLPLCWPQDTKNVRACMFIGLCDGNKVDGDLHMWTITSLCLNSHMCNLLLGEVR